jgi:S-adenosylmethionine decarboxylase
MTVGTGTQWLVDASGCVPRHLRSLTRLRALFAAVIEHHALTPVGDAQWHRFSGAAGVTGLQMLSESHLAVHTFPELRYAAFDLYSCRGGVAWPWADELGQRLGADAVRVRVVRRAAPARTTHVVMQR